MYLVSGIIPQGIALIVDHDLFCDFRVESSGVMRIDVDMFHITGDVLRFIGVLYYETL
ncbi:MAG: hypothetical protein P8J17_10010 [Halioglobus sp.]|nr:hypothetical protein [Halioglobus sp.]